MANTWGNLKLANNAPNFQVAAGDGVSANGSVMYANSQSGVFVTNLQAGIVGIDANQMGDTAQEVHKAVHSGWNTRRVDTSKVIRLTLTGGQGVNANGFIVFAGGGSGSGLNVAYTMANSANLLQLSSSNSSLNTIGSIAVNNWGTGYNVAPTIASYTGGLPSSNATLTIALGDRAGRVHYETIVAMSNVA